MMRGGAARENTGLCAGSSQVCLPTLAPCMCMMWVRVKGKPDVDLILECVPQVRHEGHLRSGRGVAEGVVGWAEWW